MLILFETDAETVLGYKWITLIINSWKFLDIVDITNIWKKPLGICKIYLLPLYTRLRLNQIVQQKEKGIIKKNNENTP
jgi:hypothetical protein